MITCVIAKYIWQNSQVAVKVGLSRKKHIIMTWYSDIKLHITKVASLINEAKPEESNERCNILIFWE